MAKHRKHRRRRHLHGLGEGILGVSPLYWLGAIGAYLWYENKHPGVTVKTAAQQALAQAQSALGPGSVVPAVNAASSSTGVNPQSIVGQLATAVGASPTPVGG